jgi:hypothetical protein
VDAFEVMRLFVEGVLRFGLDAGKPKFSTFMLAPLPNAQKEITKSLTTLAEPSTAQQFCSITFL